MSSHKHAIDLNVIFADTREHGVIDTQLPNGKYKITTKGSPARPARPARPAQNGQPARSAVPARPKGDGRVRDDIEENNILVGMDVAQKTKADALMVQHGIRPLTVDEREAYKVQFEDQLDDVNTPEHEMSEAQRFLDAIALVEAE